MKARRMMMPLSEEVTVRGESEVDEGVLLGYRSDRPLESLALTVGPGARIRTGTVIYAGTVIGSGLQTGHNVVIREENRIGDDLAIWSNSVIDYGCVIGDRVKVHTNVYVAQFTVIEDDAFLAPGVTVANDLYPGQLEEPHLQGPTIKRGAQIGVNVTLLPGVVIGEGAVIGAGSVVTQNIPARTVAYGNPARVVKRVDELEVEAFAAGQM